MALSTKNVKPQGGGVSKTIAPGKLLAKINSLKLEEDRFKPEEGGLNLVMGLEGEDLGSDFEGFFLDNNDHSAGRYKGQVGRVRTSQFPYKNAEINGRSIDRDTSILQFISQLGQALGVKDKIDEIEADTIEELVTAAEKIFVESGNFGHFTVAGREYKDKNDYTKYDLFLPKADFKARKYPVSNTEESLLPFDKEKHILASKKAPASVVNEFNTPTEEFDI